MDKDTKCANYPLNSMSKLRINLLTAIAKMVQRFKIMFHVKSGTTVALTVTL